MSSSDSTKLVIIRGNDKSFNLTVTKDDVAVDITGWSITMSVKYSRIDPDSDAVIYKDVTVHTDPTQGKSNISIEASDTEDVDPNNYFYDILFIDDLGKRQSSHSGIFQIYQEVTDGDI